ncbi:MAG: hypothetical protein KDC99_19310 [Cyclobacteriaceae bacterium]|nr:hypothetical protein [Cyclobacteriaceae bacterium]
MQSIQKHIEECFAKLVNRYGFRKGKELQSGESYSIEYSSERFVIKLEKYRHEIYVTMYKTGSDKEINLFNLLSYMEQSRSVPQSEYFEQESNVEERYRKQLTHLSTAIYQNFVSIDNFFSGDDYESKAAEIDKFVMNKYPDLFKKI